MSLKRWAGLMLMVILGAGFVFAQAQQGEQSNNAQTPQRVQRPQAARPTAAAAREQMFQERMARQADAHAAEIQQLLEIKKLAEEENATKTAAAVQALIDKKNDEFKKQVEQEQRVWNQRAERLRQRLQQAGPEQRRQPRRNAQQAEQQNQSTDNSD